MEEVAERETVPAGYEDIVLYDDDGRRVTNPVTLRAFAESVEIIRAWRESRKKVKAFGLARRGLLRANVLILPEIHGNPMCFSRTGRNFHIPESTI